MKTILFTLFATLSLSASAETLTPFLGVSKYSGADFRQVQYRELQIVNGGYLSSGTITVSEHGEPIRTPYVPKNSIRSKIENLTYGDQNPVRSELEAAPDSVLSENGCRLLFLNQLFAIRNLVDRGIITETYAQEILQKSKQLKPGQITVVQAKRPISEIELRRKYGKNIPDHFTVRVNYSPKNLQGMEVGLDSLEMTSLSENKPLGPEFYRLKNQRDRWARRKYYDEKTASVWLVGAQTLDGPAKLPLEITPKPFVLDREKYKAAWEIGRAVNLRKEDLWYSLKVAVDQAAHESALLGIPEEKAWMLAHSASRGHERLYRGDYGFRFLENHPDGPGHTVMGTTLAQFRATVERKIHEMNPEIVHFYHPEPYLRQFQSIEHFNFALPDAPVYFRNLKGYAQAKLPPPTTWKEYLANEDDKQVFIVNMPDRYSKVHYNINEHFRRQRRARDKLFWYADETMEDNSFVKTEMMNRQALVIDDARNRDSEPINWPNVLRQAVRYADENGIKTIAIPSASHLDPKLTELPGLNFERWQVLWHEQHELNRKNGIVYPGGMNQDFSAYFLKVDDIRHLFPNGKGRDVNSIREQYWAKPLFSL